MGDVEWRGFLDEFLGKERGCGCIEGGSLQSDSGEKEPGEEGGTYVDLERPRRDVSNRTISRSIN